MTILYRKQVLGATLDGASNNRRMIKLHNTAALTYKVKNLYANDGNRELYFFSDLGIKMSIYVGK